MENYCPYCAVEKNIYSKHCLICNICVDKFDHHCFWIDNCVGKNNFGYFLLFIVLITVNLIINMLLGFWSK